MSFCASVKRTTRCSHLRVDVKRIEHDKVVPLATAGMHMLESLRQAKDSQNSRHFRARVHTWAPDVENPSAMRSDELQSRYNLEPEID